MMTLIAATVRHAITQDARAAGRILTLFKRMLPKNLAALEITAGTPRHKPRSGSPSAGAGKR